MATLLMDMKEIIDTGYQEIEDFDKIDASALKHVEKLHQVVQKEGYF